MKLYTFLNPAGELGLCFWSQLYRLHKSLSSVLVLVFRFMHCLLTLGTDLPKLSEWPLKFTRMLTIFTWHNPCAVYLDSMTAIVTTFCFVFGFTFCFAFPPELTLSGCWTGKTKTKTKLEELTKRTFCFYIEYWIKSRPREVFPSTSKAW